MAILCTNAINIFAGVNGLEVRIYIHVYYDNNTHIDGHFNKRSIHVFDHLLHERDQHLRRRQWARGAYKHICILLYNKKSNAT